MADRPVGTHADDGSARQHRGASDTDGQVRAVLVTLAGQNVIAPPAAWALIDIWLDLRHDPTSSYGPKVGEIAAYEARRPAHKPTTLPARTAD